jgi:hypothetical protein
MPGVRKCFSVLAVMLVSFIVAQRGFGVTALSAFRARLLLAAYV